MMKPCKESPELKSTISVQRMRESDAYTIALHTSGRELVWRAANSVYQSLDWTGKTVAIVAGSGNNGGETVMRWRRFWPVQVSCPAYTGHRKNSQMMAQEKGVTVSDFTGDKNFGGIDILLDCILGTGFRGFPEGHLPPRFAPLTQAARLWSAWISTAALTGDTGEAELAVRSDLTVSIGFYKTGHFLGRALKLIGELVNVDIGIVLV